MRRRSVVVEPASRSADGAVARLRIGWRRECVSIQARGWAPNGLDDPFVPIGLLLGMATRRDVVVEGPVSEALVASIESVRRDLAAWYPNLHQPSLQTNASADPSCRAHRGTASFFSGGLDSFYTAITHASEITDLLFVHGFDVRLRDVALRDQVARRTRQAAQMLGKRLVEISTDLRLVSDRFANWTWFSHAGLIAVALYFAEHFAEVLIPATLADVHRPAALRGHIDRQTWTTETCRVRTDGAEATRPEKARTVARNAAASAHLRVCWENRDGAYNCGRCPKCVRTRLGLAVAGVADRFASFPGKWDVTTVRDLPVGTRSDRQFVEECLWMAEAEGRCPELVVLLRERLGNRE